MPVTLSIQAIIDAQTTALNATINAARDNVKADNTTQITNQNTSLTAAINAARDNVKADNVAQVTAQTTAINANTDTKTADLTSAVNAKGAVKSVQRGSAVPSAAASTNATLSVTVSAVNTAKAVLNIGGSYVSSGGSPDYSAKLTSSTNIDFRGWVNSGSNANVIEWQLVEYF